MTKRTLKSATAVAIDLQEAHDRLMAGEIDVKTAEAVTNNAGKQINVHKAQLEYNLSKSKMPSLKGMKFFEDAE